jgi:hypothetical protein
LNTFYRCNRTPLGRFIAACDGDVRALARSRLAGKKACRLALDRLLPEYCALTGSDLASSGRLDALKRMHVAAGRINIVSMALKAGLTGEALKHAGQRDMRGVAAQLKRWRADFEAALAETEASGKTEASVDGGSGMGALVAAVSKYAGFQIGWQTTTVSEFAQYLAVYEAFIRETNRKYSKNGSHK